jgi:hypothetical protein
LNIHNPKNRASAHDCPQFTTSPDHRPASIRGWFKQVSSAGLAGVQPSASSAAGLSG